MNLDDYILGNFDDRNPANQDPKEEEKRTFNDVVSELSDQDQEIVLDEVNYYLQLSERRMQSLRFFKTLVKSYIEILEFPMEKTSDENQKMNELLNDIKALVNYGK